MFPAIQGFKPLQTVSAPKRPVETKAPEAAEPGETFTPSESKPSAVQHLLDVSSKSLVIGAGLTLMGVPAPISATIAVGHLVTQAAPETTGKILSNTATVVGVATAGVLTLGGALAAPVAELGGQFVRHGVGHAFLPGFSGD
ncbi:hypothetical protein ABS71_00065 [bacterium SCN 62-11]|nr:hypothetical protein [Candidatus Eremiobacteraeota bacterium]ODT82847.1 MAG: hypothetical protein ABS71_00065 [bacterium SCN 62-11]